MNNDKLKILFSFFLWLILTIFTTAVLNEFDYYDLRPETNSTDISIYHPGIDMYLPACNVQCNDQKHPFFECRSFCEEYSDAIKEIDEFIIVYAPFPILYIGPTIYNSQHFIEDMNIRILPLGIILLACFILFFIFPYFPLVQMLGDVLKWKYSTYLIHGICIGIFWAVSYLYFFLA